VAAGEAEVLKTKDYHMLSGQGWQKISYEEFNDKVQWYHFDIRGFDQVIEYDQPYRGDFVSVAHAAKIVDLFDDVTTVMFAQSTDDPTIFRYDLLMVDDWRHWSTKNEGDIMRIRLSRKEGDPVVIFILRDDWYLVRFGAIGYYGFRYDSIGYKCDQLRGLANLIRDLNK
jgi:hypothetical protein